MHLIQACSFPWRYGVVHAIEALLLSRSIQQMATDDELYALSHDRVANLTGGSHSRHRRAF